VKGKEERKEKRIPMNSEKEIIIQTYREYVKAFQTLEAKAILHFFHTPFISIAAREVRVMGTLPEIETSFAQNMNILRENQYARTDIVEIYARQMSKGLALVSVVLERYTSDGKQIGGPGKTYCYTYTLRKMEADWKIVVAMAHDQEAVLKMD
jgi:ketosteroid isomerase-like protein